MNIELLFMVWWAPTQSVDAPRLGSIGNMTAGGWRILSLNLGLLVVRLWVRRKRQPRPGMVQ